MKAILEVQHLKVNFKTFAGTVHAVRDVSFQLNRGETLAIVGESGCGKTVTCRSIMHLLAKNAKDVQGKILYEGKDLLHMSEKEFRPYSGKEIAMIFQDPMTSLDPTMKVGKQITEMIHLHEKVSKKEADGRALQLMRQVGIPDAEKKFHQYPHQFSGGQRQRIVIAIALACHPKILIADEPTTALDVTIQAQILDLLKSLQKELGMSMIFITHDLGVVADVADRVQVMYAGKIVEYGLADEIFYNPRHPYTWGLLLAMPSLDENEEELYTIPGTPPALIHEPKGDAFAQRNEYALEIDEEQQPPFFRVSDTHYAATWLLDDRAPKIEPSPLIQSRWKRWEAMHA